MLPKQVDLNSNGGNLITLQCRMMCWKRKISERRKFLRTKRTNRVHRLIVVLRFRTLRFNLLRIVPKLLVLNKFLINA